MSASTFICLTKNNISNTFKEININRTKAKNKEEIKCYKTQKSGL